MTDKKTIMIDMDQVLVRDRFSDFVEQFLGNVDFSNFEGYYRQNLLVGREEEYKKAFKTKNLYTKDDGSFVTPIENSVEVVRELSKKYNVFIVTSYYWRDEVVDPAENLRNKFNYLAHFYPFLDKNNFVFMTEKTKVHFDIGIDDRTVNLTNCDEKLLFTEDRNKNLSKAELDTLKIKRVNNWLEIRNILL